MSILATDQAYYDKEYFVTGSKRMVDAHTGKEKVWGYCGTDWSGHYHIVNGLLNIFEGNINSVLDVGAGQGSFTDYAVRAGLNAKGYDFSQFAVDNPHNYAAGRLHQCDVTQGIPEADNSYDMVYSSDMCEHIIKSKIGAVLADFHRITRKWVFLQFPVVSRLEDVFNYEAEQAQPEVHPLWAHFMISGHLNMEQRIWWDNVFTKIGFILREDLVVKFRSDVPREVLTNWQNIVILEKV